MSETLYTVHTEYYVLQLMSAGKLLPPESNMVRSTEYSVQLLGNAMCRCDDMLVAIGEGIRSRACNVQSTT